MDFLAFIDIEKAYYIVERQAMWQVREVYGIVGIGLAGIRNFYKKISACILVAGNVSNCVSVNNCLRQECGIRQRLFNIYIDRTV